MKNLIKKFLLKLGFATVKDLVDMEGNLKAGIDRVWRRVNGEIKRIDNNFSVGADIDTRGDSFAIFCIAGKVECIKFARFDNPKEATEFLAMFKTDNMVIDASHCIRNITKYELGKRRYRDGRFWREESSVMGDE